MYSGIRPNCTSSTSSAIARSSLREAGGDAVDVENMDLVVRGLDDRCELFVAQLSPALPVPRATHGFVQEAIIAYRGMLRMDHGKALARRRHGTAGVGEHLQVYGLHFHGITS